MCQLVLETAHGDLLHGGSEKHNGCLSLFMSFMLCGPAIPDHPLYHFHLVMEFCPHGIVSNLMLGIVTPSHDGQEKKLTH